MPHMSDLLSQHEVLCVVPARYGSTRFPGKPLAKIAGKEMILRVCERVSLCKSLSSSIVATDDNRIYDLVRANGFDAMLTSKDHATGTDRLVEVASARSEAFILNLQGDEPLIDPDALDSFVYHCINTDESFAAATICSPLHKWDDIVNPNVVKVVRNHCGKALYFSRAPIPFPREGFLDSSLPPIWFKHVGIYLYPRDTLSTYSSLPESILEETEKLEQLRIMENGGDILVWEIEKTWPGVDTPADLKLVEKFFEGAQS